MKNIGGLLSAAREERGLSVDDIARETNIARKYIVALEAEDFTAFPAEAYILGFLKNYGEFLGLEIKMLLDQYRAVRIQEQPSPMRELLYTPPRLPRIIITGAIVAVSAALICLAVFFIMNMTATRTETVTPSRKNVEYVLNSGLLEQRFFTGDRIIIPLDGTQYALKMENLGELITISTPSGNIMLDLNREVALDVNNDGWAELHLSASDFSEHKPEMGAQLRFELLSPEAASATENAPTEQAAASEGAAEKTPAVGNAQTIWTGNNPYPFTLQVSFQGYCMFRWEILREANRQGRTERYFVKGDDLNIQAQNGVRLWISNAGSVRIQAIGGGKTVPLEIGGAGEVVVTDIAWRRGDDGRYQFALSRLEN
ncbi:MAG: helix-turn-helix domain-containing protein [Spirochaetaceae bacterium]|jgi:cytoskeletal protein RodZ|nr:helix-turn-helix domain-containing protein [Spirochaetaceae bacterium]